MMPMPSHDHVGVRVDDDVDPGPDRVGVDHVSRSVNTASRRSRSMPPTSRTPCAWARPPRRPCGSWPPMIAKLRVVPTGRRRWSRLAEPAAAARRRPRAGGSRAGRRGSAPGRRRPSRRTPPRAARPARRGRAVPRPRPRAGPRRPGAGRRRRSAAARVGHSARVVRPGPPPAVPGRRLSAADQLEPGPRPVGAAGLRLAAAGPPRQRPGSPRAVVVLLDRGMQRPRRVVEMGAADGAEVGPAGHQDRVHVVVRRDHADGDGRHAEPVADRVGVRRLVGPAERRPLARGHLARGHVDGLGAGVDERPRDGQRVVEGLTVRRPSRWPRSAPSSAGPPATPHAGRRTPRAGSAAGRRRRRRRRRCAGW